jgi:DNA-binding transcriptional regulator YiaG
MSEATVTERRRCKVCDANLPIERFYRSGRHTNGRRRTCIDCLKRQDAVRRRAEGRKIRHQRRNAHGDVWCNRCERYLPELSFREHPSRPGTLWSYCRACTREIDRERYARAMSDLESAERELERRNASKRRIARKRDTERRAFVADAIGILRRRGLTKMEVSRLTGTTIQSVLAWERKERKLSPQAAERFVIVLRETAHLPVQDRPAFRRRTPHPELDQLMARCRPQIAEYPTIRGRWAAKGDRP